MKRFLVLGVVVAALAAGWAATAQAAPKEHWVVDPYCEGQPTGAEVFTSLYCSGKAAGLGNGEIYVVVNADAGCTNQEGDHVIPGKSTTVSGPFPSEGGNFTFGDENPDNEVTASGPTNCRGQAQDPFITTENVTLELWLCDPGTGPPTFNKRGAQTNNNCESVLGPTPADIV